MMKIVFALILTGFALTFAFEENHETIDEFNEEFHIVVPDEDLKAEEEQRLKDIEAKINEHNQRFANGKASFSEKLYAFSDLSKEEIEETKMGVPGDVPVRSFGLIMPPESERISTPEMEEDLASLYATDRGYTPRAYFSNNKGLVTGAKNQMNCGSCSAFAATGLHETCMAKAGAATKNLDLSEQYIIDCGFNGGSMNGCWGAWPDKYTSWLVNDGGVSPHEGSYPYLDKNPHLNCKKGRRVKKWNSGAKAVKSLSDWSCNEDKLKKMIYEHGAAVVIIYASDDAFYDYKGEGVFDECTDNAPNHAVLAVGYGIERGQKYWLIKNSWGKNWGLNGFIRIKRGTNHCRTEDSCFTAKCVANGRQEAAPTTPKPPPVPTNFWCDISGMFQPGDPLNGKFTFRTKGPDGKLIVAEVRCKNDMCTPDKPGPSNACMYICGKVKC